MITYVEISYIIDNIEDSDDTITTTASKHISTVTEINWESSSTEISDLSAWFEHIVSIEHFYFINSRSTSDNEISGVLLELRAINEARFLWW